MASTTVTTSEPSVDAQNMSQQQTCSVEAAVPGQKHRRGMSSNSGATSVAHRRINSVGEAALISKYPNNYDQPNQRPGHDIGHPPRYPPNGSAVHHRVDSAGLDLLTAAADVSKEELAVAAGVAPPRNDYPSVRTSYSPSAPPPAVPRDYHHDSYPPPAQHARHMPPPPSANGYAPPPPPTHYPPYYSYPHSMETIDNSHPRYQHREYYAQPPPPTYYQHNRNTPPAFSSHYPVQSAQPPMGAGPIHHERKPSYNMDPQFPPPPPPPQGGGHSRTSSASFGCERIETDEKLFANKDELMPPPPRPGSSSPTTWSNGRVVSSSSLGTEMDVQDGKKAMHGPNVAGVAPVGNPRSSPRASPPITTMTGEHRHHRVTSSFSSIGTFTGPNEMQNLDEAMPPAVEVGGESFLQQIAVPPPQNGEQRMDRYRGREYFSSSPTSFSQGRRPSPVMQYCSTIPPGNDRPAPNNFPNICARPVLGQSPGFVPNSSENNSNETTPNGTNKRVRRKCTVAGCTNRVVQGGLCISHGAKRKTCKHPGCKKNVKKAGLCSAHGPARKRCNVEGCPKVAVQGGRCISHGAKKKLCSFEGCKKQAILTGMCKKHHDQKNGIVPARGGRKNTGSTKKDDADSPPLCVEVVGQPEGSSSEPPQASISNAESKTAANAQGHRRGLSIFQDMSAVDTIIGNGDIASAEDSTNAADTSYAPPAAEERATPLSTSSDDPMDTRGDTQPDECSSTNAGSSVEKKKQPRKGCHQRGLSLFTDEKMAERIIQNKMII